MKPRVTTLTDCIVRPFRERDGVLWMWALWVTAFIALGGLAVDTAKAWRMKAMMQATADAAAHAGSVAMWKGEDGVAAVRTYVDANLPASKFGDVLNDADIQYGVWDPETQVFTLQDSSDGADSIRVSLHRVAARGNAERTTLLRVLGIDNWQIEVSSAARYFDSIDECLRNGIVARGEIDLQSNNVFDGNICVHSQDHVSVRNHNYFAEGTTVSMPDPTQLNTPGSDVESNPGLADALREGHKDPKIVDDLPALIEALKLEATGLPIANAAVNWSGLLPGMVYYVNCTGGGDKTMTIPDGAVIYNTTIVTNCGIKFDQGARIYESVIATTGEHGSGAATVQAPSSVVIGYDDGCAEGGGSQILINGSFKAASSFAMNGSQIIATGDISIAAQIQGLDGISLISGGEIDVTSNNAFGACPGSEFPVIYNSYAVVN